MKISLPSDNASQTLGYAVRTIAILGGTHQSYLGTHSVPYIPGYTHSVPYGCRTFMAFRANPFNHKRNSP